MLKFVSFNVNGLRAIWKKNFPADFAALQADVFALQETKLQAGQMSDQPFPDYQAYWHYSTVKKGYSGTAVFSKLPVLKVRYGIGDEAVDAEGRVLTLEFPQFFFVTAYVPNSQDGLKRLPFRLNFEEKFADYLQSLDVEKPVIVCGDLNVAHEEIDLANPDSNHFNPGFSDEERSAFSQLLARGFVDTFRLLAPQEKCYSWWSYRTRARERNIGWRIDYFLVSERLVPAVKGAKILSDIMGSDHCPIELDLDETLIAACNAEKELQ